MNNNSSEKLFEISKKFHDASSTSGGIDYLAQVGTHANYISSLFEEVNSELSEGWKSVYDTIYKVRNSLNEVIGEVC